MQCSTGQSRFSESVLSGWRSRHPKFSTTTVVGDREADDSGYAISVGGELIIDQGQRRVYRLRRLQSFLSTAGPRTAGYGRAKTEDGGFRCSRRWRVHRLAVTMHSADRRYSSTVSRVGKDGPRRLPAKVRHRGH